MKTPSFFLDVNNTIRGFLPLLSLGKDTARLNPKLSISPIVGVKTGGSRVGGPDLCVKADGNKK